jgi:hypothetical protein
MKTEVVLTISPRLKSVLPPLTDEQRDRLEENIRSDGEITDPICYWFDGTANVIVDGMNRFEIAGASNLGYDVREMSFTDYDAVELWMLERQAGKRNLTPNQLSELRGRYYNRAKKDDKANLDQSVRSVDQFEPPEETLGKPRAASKTTAEQVAEKFEVSPATVKRDAARVSIIDNLKEGVKSSLGKTVHEAALADLQKLAKLDDGAQQIVARAVRVGQVKTLKEALKLAPASKDNGKPAKPVKALEGREAEAFDARRQVTGMYKTIAQWFIPIDKIRSAFPGKVGDRVQKQMDVVYQSLQEWEKGIK